MGADTETGDESDSHDEDLPAPIGRNTLCAWSDGFTNADRGTAWKAAQMTDSDGPATRQEHHNSVDALVDNNDNGAAAQLGSWAQIVKSGGT